MINREKAVIRKRISRGGRFYLRKPAKYKSNLRN